MAARRSALARRCANLSHRTVAHVRAAPAAWYTFLASIWPKTDTVEARGAVCIIEAKPVLSALRQASRAGGLTDGRRHIGASRVQANIRRCLIRIERACALAASIEIDVHTAPCKVDAVEVRNAIDLDARTKAPVRPRHADVVFRTVIIEVTRKTAIHAAPAFAKEPRHAVEPRVAAGCRLDAALAFTWHIDALTAWERKTVVVGDAGTAAAKDALLDRRTLEAVAPRLDAHEARRAIDTRVAKIFARTGTTK